MRIKVFGWGEEGKYPTLLTQFNSKPTYDQDNRTENCRNVFDEYNMLENLRVGEMLSTKDSVGVVRNRISDTIAKPHELILFIDYLGKYEESP